ncbi:MAG: 4'-phosphopantetheinyl transferase superfamily protein, partial [Pseudomonadota bacterium]|nr:4'-phosphopantetheinyl transferase superfamily protein [Pseudomonadota bacterium]
MVSVFKTVAEQMITHLEEVLSDWLFEHSLARNWYVYGGLASEMYMIPSQDLRFIGNANAKRRSEFIGGRWCAHRALEEIGFAAASIPMGTLGAPLWPIGTVGSITHDGGVCLALVTDSQSMIGLGIDLFDVERAYKCDYLADLFLSPSEILHVLKHHKPNGYAHLFSAKESVVKAISLSIGSLIDLHDIEITFTGSLFSATVAGYANVIKGRCQRYDRFILSYACLESPLRAKPLDHVQVSINTESSPRHYPLNRCKTLFS